MGRYQQGKQEPVKALCPVKRMVAADGFVFAGFPGINVPEEHLAAYFNICTQFDIYCQLCLWRFPWAWAANYNVIYKDQLRLTPSKAA